MEEEKRLRNLEIKVAHIENWLQANGRQFTTSDASLSPHSSKIAPQAPAPAPTGPTSILQEKISSNPMNILGVVGIICFIMAAAFIVKLAIESGWLTPARQMGLSALFGIALIGAGLPVLRLDRLYASLLPAAGIIVLYLTAFGTHNYHKLVGFEVAICLTTAVSIMTIFIYNQVKQEAFPILACAGSYLSPIVFSLNIGFSEFTFHYLLLCSVVFSGLSIHFQTRSLTLVSSYLAIGTTALVGLVQKNDPLTATALAIQFLILAVAVVLYTRENRKPLTLQESQHFFPLLIFFYAVEYYFLSRIIGDAAPWVSLGFALFLVVLYISARKMAKDTKLESGPVVLSFASLVFFHSFYLQILSDDFKPILMNVLILTAALLPQRLNLNKKPEKNFLLPLVLAGIVVVVEYFRIVGALVTGPDLRAQLFSIITLLSILLLYFSNRTIRSNEQYGSMVLIVAHAMAIVSLYRLSYDYGSLAVSLSWVIYAALTISMGFMKKDPILVKSSLVALIFAAAKALLYDVSQAATLVRIFCLLLTGAALYGCGLLLKKIADWKPQS